MPIQRLVDPFLINTMFLANLFFIFPQVYNLLRSSGGLFFASLIYTNTAPPT